MERGNEEAGSLHPQEPGRGNRHSVAASSKPIAEFQFNLKEEGQTFRARNIAVGIAYSVHPTVGEPFVFTVKGHVAWALDQLRGRGERLHADRPTRSALERVRLRSPGHHARYVLRSTVQK